MTSEVPPDPGLQLSPTRMRLRHAFWLGLIVLSIATSFWWDLAHVRWAQTLSLEGSPPPAVQGDSPTGYANGQRHFLGTAQRGETYRWIADAQEFLQGNVSDRGHYTADNVPNGRAQLLPTLYTAWLAGLSWVIHVFTATPPALAVEQVAVWEPVVVHLLVLLSATIVMTRRFGIAWGGFSAAFLTLHPLVFSQHLPGALGVDAWALWLSAYALAEAFLPPRRITQTAGLQLAPTLAVAFALALNPAFGFAAVVIIAVATVTTHAGARPADCLRWSLVGGAVVLMAWLLTGVPLDPTVSELRHAHPWYAFAWIGLGAGLYVMKRAQAPDASRRRLWLLAPCLALLAPLLYVHLKHGYGGWLHTSAELERFASIEGSPIHPHLLAWFAAASWTERVVVLLPIIAAVVGIVVHVRQLERRSTESTIQLRAAVVFFGVLLLASIHLRWLVVALLLSLPALAAVVIRGSATAKRALAISALVYLFALVAWDQALPTHLRTARQPSAASPKDLEALVFRHFSYWLSNQAAGQELRVLAPPALSDSLVFHGGTRVLLSSAWESHPGHIAASRILSSLESTEAQAVIDSVGLTHVVLASWDVVLPLLVKEPTEPDRDTLHERLTRWVLPRYLRPLPYRLPPTPGYEAEVLAVFEVVPPQDEALALSRLAEYFVEVQRPEPAGLVAETLAQAYSQDINATIARAYVFEAIGNRTASQTEMSRLVRSVREGSHPPDADRRLLRALVLALGRQHEPARAELAEANRTLSADTLRLLTPYQTFLLRRLLQLYQLDFQDAELAELARIRSAAYAP